MQGLKFLKLLHTVIKYYIGTFIYHDNPILIRIQFQEVSSHLSIITMGFQMRNLDHFLKFLLTGLSGFRLCEFDCTCTLCTDSNLRQEVVTLGIVNV